MEKYILSVLGSYSKRIAPHPHSQSPRLSLPDVLYSSKIHWRERRRRREAATASADHWAICSIGSQAPPVSAPVLLLTGIRLPAVILDKIRRNTNLQFWVPGSSSLQLSSTLPDETNFPPHPPQQGNLYTPRQRQALRGFVSNAVESKQLKEILWSCSLALL